MKDPRPRISLWEATAPPLNLVEPAFEAADDFDVAVVGAGFTGLSSAIRLRERGARVVVFDAGPIGGGASGLNNGQVIPGLKLDPDELVERFGDDLGDRVVTLSQKAADTVFELINHFRIDCDPVRKGWIQAAHSERALMTVSKRAERLRSLGAPVQILSCTEVERRTGTAFYRGGWVDNRAGTVNPLAFVRGLAEAAAGLGAKIFQETPVERMVRDAAGRWILSTARGAIQARQVVIGTNAYTGRLWPTLQHSILPVTSLQGATEPLGEVGNLILPGGECVSETRKLAFSFRKDREGRLVIAARGPVFRRESDRSYNRMHGAFERMMPKLAGTKLEYSWSGKLALTMDGLPHLHIPAPGVVMALGYNGRGIAMASTMGGIIAEQLSGANRLDFPVTDLKAVPFHAARRPIIAAGVAYYWLRDRLGFAS